MNESGRFVESPPPLSDDWTRGDLFRFWPTIVGADADAVADVVTMDGDGVLTIRITAAVFTRALAEDLERFLCHPPKSIDGVSIERFCFLFPMGLVVEDNDDEGEEWKRDASGHA